MHILICLFAQKMPNLIKSQIFVFLFEFCSAIDVDNGTKCIGFSPFVSQHYETIGKSVRKTA